jgi:hypothetical protein
MNSRREHTTSTSRGWRPDGALEEKIDRLLSGYRELAAGELGALTKRYYPALLERGDNEYRKMVELSTKMTMVGHACSETAGFPFDRRRQTLSALYGGCCFLADSFIDDFGEAQAAAYLERFELLLTQGWFRVGNERERLFYVILSRLFGQRDLLDLTLRQAIFSLFLAQRRDVALRMDAPSFRALPRHRQLAMLRECARDRSGHAILVLTRLLAPRLALRHHHLLFLAGALIMYIDDHGDCYADRRGHRLTYMNEVRHPEPALRRLFQHTLQQLRSGLPNNEGKQLLCGFLYRYFVTRLEKHSREAEQGGLSWAVYE